MSFVQKNEEPKKTTIAALDGVRAFACFCVISYHITHLTWDEGVWGIGNIEKELGVVGHLAVDISLSGNSGVTLFFILSGFLLFLPYAKSMLFDTSWPEARRFYLRRIFRIWPGYYVSLILLILIANRSYLQLANLKQLFLFLTFLMDSSANTYQKINGPFWTLAVEWQYYMLLPLLALGMGWLVRRGTFKRRLTILLLCLGGLLLWGLATRWWGESWQLYFMPAKTNHIAKPVQYPLLAGAHPFLPAGVRNFLLFFVYGQNGKFMEDFAVGMLISVFYTIAQQLPEHPISRFCYKSSRYMWFLGLTFLFFAVVWPDVANWFYQAPFVSNQQWGEYFLPWVGNNSPLAPYIGAHNWLSEMPFALGYGCCMQAILFGKRDLQWFWQLGWMRWLGLLSYGMYIWHLPIIEAYDNLMHPFQSSINNIVYYGLYWVLVVVIVIPFCYLFHILIEQPWIKYGVRVTGKKVTKIPPVDVPEVVAVGSTKE